MYTEIWQRDQESFPENESDIALICPMRISDCFKNMDTVDMDTAKKQLYIDRINPNILGLISKCTFAVGLFIELSIVILDKSEYIIQYEGQWFRLTFLLFGISLITTRHPVREWISLVFSLVIGLISYRYTGRNEIIRFVVFVWACQGKNMQKVLKGTFWYTLVGCIGIVFLSVFGIFGEVAKTQVYRWEEETRYCFGMGHPNSFHCIVFALTLLGIYCYFEKLKIIEYGSIVLLHILVFVFTKSRTGLMVSLLSICVILCLRYIKLLQRWNGIYIGGIVFLLLCTGFSVFCAKYSIFHPLLGKMNDLLTGRILSLYETINHEGMLSTWSLWSVARNNYYFDMGFVRLFYWYGIIPGTLFILAQIRLLWIAMKKMDYMLLAILIGITLYSVLEAHFVSVYLGRNYILFFFGMYLSDMLPSIGEKHAESTSVI